VSAPVRARAADATPGAVLRHGGTPVVVWSAGPRPSTRFVYPVDGGREAYEVAVRDLSLLGRPVRVVASAL
jgi:hypothetical protein